MLGGYRLIAQLARGGMSVVYLAVAEQPNTAAGLVVLKELKPGLDEPTVLAMFQEEARLATRLQHPNVVRTLQAGRDGNRHFLVMEFLDGQSLFRILSHARKQSVALSWRFHGAVFCAALAGLAYAHAAKDAQGKPMGIVHRDVSPQNIFVGYDGHVKVLDFGIAKATKSAVDTRAGLLKGKLAYMAPEQAAGLDVDARSDVFAVGVMLWEAAAGRRFWSSASDDTQILQCLFRGKLPAEHSSALAQVPAELGAVITKATALDPSERHASASDLLTELRTALGRAGTPPFAPAEMASLLNEFFADDRARLHAAIDDALKRRPVSGEYPAPRGKAQPPPLPPSAPPVAAQPTPPEPQPMGREELIETGEEIGRAAQRLQESERLAALPRSVECMARAVQRAGSPEVATALEGLADCMEVVETFDLWRAAVLQHLRAASTPPPQPAVRTMAPVEVDVDVPTARRPPTALAAGAALGAFALLAWTLWTVAPRIVGAHPAAASSPVPAPTAAPPQPTQTAAAQAPEVATVATPEKAHVIVRVAPPQARIVVDGKRELENPYVAILPRDGTTHSVHVEADGYEPRDHWFDTFEDVTIILALARKLPPRTTAPRAGSPSALAPSAPPPAGTGTTSGLDAGAPTGSVVVTETCPIVPHPAGTAGTSTSFR